MTGQEIGKRDNSDQLTSKALDCGNCTGILGTGRDLEEPNFVGHGSWTAVGCCQGYSPAKELLQLVRPVQQALYSLKLPHYTPQAGRHFRKESSWDPHIGEIGVRDNVKEVDRIQMARLGFG